MFGSGSEAGLPPSPPPIMRQMADDLRRRGLTIATAESCTGGLVGYLITEMAGSSDYFVGGVVSYSDAVKVAQLGVPAELLAAHGAVSAEVAEAMAAGARERLGADLAVSVTGVAGPGGGTERTPVGTVYLGLADAAGSHSRRLQLTGLRTDIRMRAATSALTWLAAVVRGDGSPAPD
jgi:nicotinamide-nucleotide amidase